MSPEQLEDEIVAQLKTLISDDLATVIVLPNDDDGYDLPGNIGKIVVAYDNSDYKDPLDTLAMSQDEWIEFIVTIQSRNLRTVPTSIYQLLILVKKALIGFVPSDCSVPISGKWYGYPDVGTKGRIGEVWVHEFHMRTKSVLVQYIDVPGNGIISGPDTNINLTTDAQLMLPSPLPLQGLQDTGTPIIQLVES